MTPFAAGLIGIAFLFLIIFSGMPVAVSLLLVGFLGHVYVQGFENALWFLQTLPFRTFFNYFLAALPLFVFMGELSHSAGVSRDLYDVTNTWLGHLRGGLAMATVWACAGFAAVSGSSVATAATFGAVAIPEMRRYKYDPSLATGAVAAGGTMGILIPPSLALVIYAIITEQSVGQLFMAGVIPGVLEATFYMITIYILVKINPSLGPRGPVTSFGAKIRALKGVWTTLVLFLLVMGGIYGGLFTPTEAAGVGAFGALFLGFARRKLTRQGLVSAIARASMTTAFLLFIIFGAMVFGYFMTISRVPDGVAYFLAGLEVNRYIIMAGIILMYLILGCFLDGLAIVLLTVPVLLPVMLQLGWSPIWFGIIIIRVLEMGLITPPYGLNVFIIAGVVKDVPIGTIFRGIVPFLIADIFHVALLIAVPQLSLFLPGVMK